MSLRLVFAVPGDLGQITGGYAYDRRLIAGLRAQGWAVEVLRLPDGFPAPSPGELEETAAALDGVPDGSLVLVDGLAFGAMPDIAARHGARLRLAALVHHPLGYDGGLAAAERPRLIASERAALRHARAVVATSRTTAETLERAFGVPRARLHAALPGTDPAPRAPADGDPPRIVAVGSLLRGKGHDVLVEALALLRELPWRCRIVGGPRDPEVARALRRQVRDAGLEDRIAFAGEVPEAGGELAAADLFALATRHEGYGMAFAEALRRGLPVVGCAVGAVPEVVPAEAGELVPADDAPAFADALRRLLVDPALRRRRADAAWRAGQALPSWDDTARRVAAALAGAA
ncbi:glycosyltransferase family 4 protein [Coralloluteibacterium thermophilus]|uniref:Glycosyltransferase family 4 protein n=1 Tax=Coralloluteibacterium thermophilum TaxID=2707049 RepID=A0ABV9NJT0_9GAMM